MSYRHIYVHLTIASYFHTLPGLSAPVPKKIAFFVGLTNNMGPVTDHTDIVFDQVITNIGHAYDINTGRFTAPVNATYQFNVIVSAQGRQKVSGASIARWRHVLKILEPLCARISE
jgi:hypothetical protein